MDVSNQTIFQNIYRAYLLELGKNKLSIDQRKAIYAITACRSGELGTSYYQCLEGHALHEQHHSCRHRSCYVCSRGSQHDWVEAQKRRLLNCPHFHLVFTLPSEYRVLWQYNTAWFARTLFACVQETVMTLMQDERHHGLTPGLLATLHTWGRQLNLHPHIHCLVTAGGVDRHGQWHPTGDYLLPVQALKILYRGKLQARIKEAFEADDIRLPPDMDAVAFMQHFKQAYAKAWSVRVEEQYRHGKGVVLYLSRYMKGGPLHPRQITHCNAQSIGFNYKDHRDGRRKVLTLSPMAFLKRLLCHVPPKGIHTVRHYGLYAAASRSKRNASREQMGDLSEVETGTGADWRSVVMLTCRACGSPMQCRYRSGKSRIAKGISIIKSGASSVVQQIVETDIANVARGRDPCKIQV